MYSNYLLKPILIDRVNDANVRQTFYNINTLSDLLTSDAGDTVLTFFKEINLYTKI
jgi:hypothetical protein